MRKKDVVLMATVTSFESLPHPSRSELRQFAELFSPLFAASSDEARREAVAALSQSENVPQPVAFFIASQPISVAAPFLTSSPCLSDDALVAIARSQGEAHARAIVRREALSPTVIDALVGLRFDRARARTDGSETMEPQRPTQAMVDEAEKQAREAERGAREEALRQRIKSLVNHVDRPPSDRLGLRNFSAIQQALLVRFARNRETGLFASVLADTLSASRWLSERILLDISGQQLATTLKGLGMEMDDAVFILQRIYDHLSTRHGEISRAEFMWDALDENECGKRVEAWRRADSYTYAEPQPAPLTAANRDVREEDMRQDMPRIIRTTATARKPLTRAR